MFAGEYNINLLPAKVRRQIIENDSNINLNDKENSKNNLNNGFYRNEIFTDLNQYIDYYDHCLKIFKDEGYLMCIRCGKIINVLDNEYKNEVFENDVSDILCENCKIELELELNSNVFL